MYAGGEKNQKRESEKGWSLTIEERRSRYFQKM